MWYARPVTQDDIINLGTLEIEQNRGVLKGMARQECEFARSEEGEDEDSGLEVDEREHDEFDELGGPEDEPSLAHRQERKQREKEAASWAEFQQAELRRRQLEAELEGEVPGEMELPPLPGIELLEAPLDDGEGSEDELTIEPLGVAAAGVVRATSMMPLLRRRSYGTPRPASKWRAQSVDVGGSSAGGANGSPRPDAAHPSSDRSITKTIRKSLMQLSCLSSDTIMEEDASPSRPDRRAESISPDLWDACWTGRTERVAEAKEVLVDAPSTSSPAKEIEFEAGTAVVSSSAPLTPWQVMQTDLVDLTDSPPPAATLPRPPALEADSPTRAASPSPAVPLQPVDALLGTPTAPVPASIASLSSAAVSHRAPSPPSPAKDTPSRPSVSKPRGCAFSIIVPRRASSIPPSSSTFDSRAASTPRPTLPTVSETPVHGIRTPSPSVEPENAPRAESPELAVPPTSPQKRRRGSVESPGLAKAAAAVPGAPLTPPDSRASARSAMVFRQTSPQPMEDSDATPRQTHRSMDEVTKSAPARQPVRPPTPPCSRGTDTARHSSPPKRRRSSVTPSVGVFQAGGSMRASVPGGGAFRLLGSRGWFGEADEDDMDDPLLLKESPETSPDKARRRIQSVGFPARRRESTVHLAAESESEDELALR